MKPEALSLLDRMLTRIRREHVGRLLSILDESLGGIKIDRRATIGESLEHFKQATAAAQAEYGEQVRMEVLSVVAHTQQVLDAEGKTAILNLVSKYVTEALYLERFRIYEEAFDRHVRRYGVTIDLADFRVDLVRSLYGIGSANFVRAAMAKLADDLELIVLRPVLPASIPSTAAEGKLEQANRLIKLEPNFFGIGVNLNYLIRRLFGKGE